MHAVALTVVLMAGLGQCETCGEHGELAATPWYGHGDHLAFAPMPQTCYSPTYGCYYSNNRHMHRYPAFHGYYYRRPYNYRNMFDYPWHAELHEPTSLFSYHVPEEELLDAPLEELPAAAAPRSAPAQMQAQTPPRTASPQFKAPRPSSVKPASMSRRTAR